MKWYQNHKGILVVQRTELHYERGKQESQSWHHLWMPSALGQAPGEPTAELRLVFPSVKHGDHRRMEENR